MQNQRKKYKMGQYDEEMKKSSRTILKNHYSKTATAMNNRMLTYSGWLTLIKKLSGEEVSSLLSDNERDQELRLEYEIWMENKCKGCFRKFTEGEKNKDVWSKKLLDSGLCLGCFRIDESEKDPESTKCLDIKGMIKYRDEKRRKNNWRE